MFGLIPEGSSLVGILVCGGCGVLFIFGQLYAAHQAELYVRLQNALGAEQRTQLEPHPAHGRHCVCCYGCCFDCNFTAGHHFGEDAATMILLLAVVFGGSS